MRPSLSVEKRSEFFNHLAVYVLVNALLVTIWWVTGHDFFWPIFPLFGWGIGVFFHAVDVFRRPYSEERIRHEPRLRSTRRRPAVTRPCREKPSDPRVSCDQ